MKKKMFFLFFLFFLLLNSTFFVSGIGIKYGLESAIVKDNSRYCVTYGLYNPADISDGDVMGYLSATGDLAKIYDSPEPILIPRGTSSQDAIPVTICFNVTKVYEEDCIVGLFCETKCQISTDPTKPFENYRRLSGEILAQSFAPETSTGGTGSITKASATVPLDLVVECVPKERNQPAFYISIGIIILAIAIIIWLLTRKSRKKKK